VTRRQLPDGEVPEASAAGPGTGHTDVLDTEPDHSSDSPVGPLVVGVVMLAFGLVMLNEALKIEGEVLDPEGPLFLPIVVLSLWTLLAVLYLGQQVLRVLRHRELLPAERFTHMPSALALVVMLVVYAYVLNWLGYLIATALFFVGAARAMGSRQPTRDAVIAVGMSVVVYFTFTRALGVHLPEGVLGI
jgi:putative tricarboxylic transport membrane protein